MPYQYIDLHSHKDTYKEKNQNQAHIFSLYCPTLPSLAVEKVQVLPLPEKPFCLGLHPWWVEQYSVTELIPLFERALDSKFCLAFGEIGLDRVKPRDFAIQLKALREQLHWLQRVAPEIPLVFHCVRAYSDLWSELKTYTKHRALLFHDYNGTQDMTNQLLKHERCWFGFGKKLFQATTHAYQVFGQIPIDRIFLETDDQRDYSIENISEQAAKLRGLELTQLQQALNKNLEKCFPQVAQLLGS